MTSRQVDTDVLIIGGGISGLATAWWLSQYGIKVKLWEKSSRLGGKIHSQQHQGYTTEQAASMIMNFRSEVDLFMQYSGLDKYKTARLMDSESKRYLLHQGRLQALPMTIGKMFASPLWSLPGKLRLLMEPLIGASKQEQETVSQFIRRRLGTEFLEKAMEPFIAGILASNPDTALAQYVLPRLTRLEKKYGSLTAGIIAHKITGQRTARVTENFSFQGGMSTLCNTLGNKLELGVETGVQVKKLINNGKAGWQTQAQSEQGEVICQSRHVILSTPAYTAADIVESALPQLSRQLQQIKYAPISIVHLGMSTNSIGHPLNSAGFLVPRREKIGINGNLWMSSLFSGRAPAGQVLLSSYIGGSRDPQAVQLSEADSVDRVMRALKPILGISRYAEPEMVKVDKHYQGLPLYQGNYHAIHTEISQELAANPGLHIQANYIDGVSIRDRISMAHKQAQSIAQAMQKNNTSKIYSLPADFSSLLTSVS